MELEYTSKLHLPEKRVRDWARTGIAPNLNLNANDYNAMYAACCKWVEENPKELEIGTIVLSSYSNILYVYNGNGEFINLVTGVPDYSKSLMECQVIWAPPED